MNDLVKRKLDRLGDVTKQAQRRLRKLDGGDAGKDKDFDLADELGLLVGYFMGILNYETHLMDEEKP